MTLFLSLFLPPIPSLSLSLSLSPPPPPPSISLSLSLSLSLLSHLLLSPPPPLSLPPLSLPPLSPSPPSLSLPPPLSLPPSLSLPPPPSLSLSLPPLYLSLSLSPLSLSLSSHKEQVATGTQLLEAHLAESRREAADLWMWFIMGPDLTLQSLGRGKLKMCIKHWDDLHCKWVFRDM